MTPTTHASLLLPCPSCHGRGVDRISTGGRFSDWIAVTCATCAGVGMTEATVEEIAELDRIVAEIEANVEMAEAEGAQTVAAIEGWLGIKQELNMAELTVAITETISYTVTVPVDQDLYDRIAEAVNAKGDQIDGGDLDVWDNDKLDEAVRAALNTSDAWAGATVDEREWAILPEMHDDF